MNERKTVKDDSTSNNGKHETERVGKKREKVEMNENEK